MRGPYLTCTYPGLRISLKRVIPVSFQLYKIPKGRAYKVEGAYETIVKKKGRIGEGRREGRREEERGGR
jgi:hypothetical protein